MVNVFESGTLCSSFNISNSFRGSFSFPERFDASGLKLIVQITGILSDTVLWQIDGTIHWIPDFLRFFWPQCFT